MGYFLGSTQKQKEIVLNIYSQWRGKNESVDKEIRFSVSAPGANAV